MIRFFAFDDASGIAQRGELVPNELVRIKLRHPFRDGTEAIDLDPLSLLCRLAASVPPPHMHTVRYAGLCRSVHSPAYAHLGNMLTLPTGAVGLG